MDGEIVSWFAVVVAAVAAGFSWYTAQQSRRQADAVLGDLPPVISLYQPNEQVRVFARCELEIINHNRRPIYIDRVKFDFPEGLRIFQEHGEQRADLISIMEAVVHGKRDFVFDIPLRMQGAHQSKEPHVLTTVFKVSTLESQTPTDPFDVSAVVWYRIDGEDQAHEEGRSMTWRPVSKD